MIATNNARTWANPGGLRSWKALDVEGVPRGQNRQWKGFDVSLPTRRQLEEFHSHPGLAVHVNCTETEDESRNEQSSEERERYLSEPRRARCDRWGARSAPLLPFAARSPWVFSHQGGSGASASWWPSPDTGRRPQTPRRSAKPRRRGLWVSGSSCCRVPPSSNRGAVPRDRRVERWRWEVFQNWKWPFYSKKTEY